MALDPRERQVYELVGAYWACVDLAISALVRKDYSYALKMLHQAQAEHDKLFPPMRGSVERVPISEQFVDGVLCPTHDQNGRPLR